MDWGAVDYY